jgi:trigger factor
LKLETELTSDHQAKLTVEVEAERLEVNKQRAAVKLAKRVKIPGFRPGKAPYPVIVRTIGEDRILEEAMNQLIEEVYPEVLKEAGIKAYGPGSLDKVPSMDPLVLEFSVPLEAVVTLGDYRSVRKPYEPGPVTEEMIAQTIQSLRENQAVLEPVERPAQEGDAVSIKLNAHFIESDEGEFIKDHSTHLLVRTEPDPEEWPFDGFSKLLIGKTAGDQDSVMHDFPADYLEENLRGKKALFSFQIEAIKSRTLPELDDDFVKSIGDFENMESLRKNVVDSLEQQSEEAYNQNYDESVINELVEQSTFQFPPQMLDEEIHQSIHDLENRLSRQGLNLDVYLKTRGIDEKALHEEISPAAEKRLKRNLLLFEIGKNEDIRIDQEELQKHAGSTLNYLQQVLPEKEARRLNERNVQTNVINNVMVDLLTHKTVERMRMIASGKIDQMEAVSPAESLDTELVEEKIAATEIEEGITSTPSENQSID